MTDRDTYREELRKQLAAVRQAKAEAIYSGNYQRAADLRGYETELSEICSSLNIFEPDPPHQKLIRQLVTRIRDLQAEVARLEKSQITSDLGGIGDAD